MSDVDGLEDEDAPDATDFVVCAMQSVMRTASERKPGEEFPFCVAFRVAGADDPDAGTDDPVVQLDFYDIGDEAASFAASRGDRRMKYLARHLVDVEMPDGSIANADFVRTELKPCRLPFKDDEVVRYSARYTVGLSYVAV